MLLHSFIGWKISFIIIYFLLAWLTDVTGDNCMFANGGISPGQCLYSYSNTYKFCLNNDGSITTTGLSNNAVTYTAFGPKAGATSLVTQADGNVVAYAGAYYWTTWTNGNGPDIYLIIQDDGDLKVFTLSGTQLWACSSLSTGACMITTCTTCNVCLNQPTRAPTFAPTATPTFAPTAAPTFAPTYFPTGQPSRQPSSEPSIQPTRQPTSQPSRQPTNRPTSQPTIQPTSQPTRQPTTQPSRQPSSQPTRQPSTQPSTQPSSQPTPTIQPTSQPTRQPTTQPSRQPSSQPTRQPSTQPSTQPSSQPTRQPTSQPSSQPTTQLSRQPSSQPTRQPSTQPSSQPSSQPTRQPTSQPSSQPTTQPSRQPSSQPIRQPSTQPSSQPSSQPTRQPTSQPSSQPTTQPSRQPSSQPTRQPSTQPSSQPSSQPTRQPTSQPSSQPTTQPSRQPSSQPTRQPSTQPSSQPSSQPTRQPTSQPSSQPTTQLSRQPSSQPTRQPSTQPSSQPSSQPTRQPTSQPSSQPTTQLSRQPSSQPTRQPSTQPSSQPSSQPTRQPTSQPSSQPTTQLSRQPSSQPTRQPSTQPSSQPSSQPTRQPTSQPSSQPTTQPSRQPSSQPIRQPSTQPSSQPSSQPTRQPTSQPSSQPTTQPSRQPSSQPTRQPSTQPSSQPSSQPTRQPTSQPSSQPTTQPSRQPSSQPTRQPSTQPSSQPSSQPTRQPTSQPSSQPTTQLSRQPSSQPTRQPSTQPSSQPSSQPTRQPTSQPSSQPTTQPSRQPSSQPIRQPSTQPSSQPSSQPTRQPTSQPSSQPTTQPSRQPSSQPTRQPSTQPSSQPSSQPTRQPTSQPSSQPTTQPSRQPSSQPTRQPSTQPSSQPSSQPTRQPTSQPSSQPTTQLSRQPSSQPTRQPSTQPSSQPSSQPTRQPTSQPSSQPTTQPSRQPSSQPIRQPSTQPSSQPSSQPTRQPTSQPSSQPTTQPSRQPSSQPTRQPSTQPSSQPSSQPTRQPTSQPSSQPTTQPSRQPSSQPTRQPSTQPSSQPSSQPIRQPTSLPSSQPTTQLSRQPSSQPTRQPSTQPSSQPSSQPTRQPTSQPSSQPTTQPSRQPSSQPTRQPSTQPSSQPSSQPTRQPTSQPSSQPTTQPSRQPSSQPTRQPSTQPSSQPSSQPTRQPTSQPSSQPTTQPSRQPSSQPTYEFPTTTTTPISSPANSSSEPTIVSTVAPSMLPTPVPSASPTEVPSEKPTLPPSVSPIFPPSVAPTVTPTVIPTHAQSRSTLYPFLLSKAITPERNNITINIQLDQAGIVYMNVMDSVVNSSMSSGSIYQSLLSSTNRYIINNNNNNQLTIEISGLVPMTRYIVYFLTQTMDGSAIMPTSEVMRNKMTTTTTCCREITVSLQSSVLLANTNYDQFLQYSLTNPPPHSDINIRTSISCQGTRTSATLNLTDLLVPLQVTFPSSEAISSSPVSRYVSLNGLPVSRCTIRAKITAADASAYRFRPSNYINSTTSSNNELLLTVDVRDGGSQSIPAPQFQSAIFSNNGSVMILTFDSATNQGDLSSSTFHCQALFSFACAETSLCQWLERKRVAATLATGDNCVVPGDTIRLASSAVIKAACLQSSSCQGYDRWPALETSKAAITVLPPTVPVSPSIVLNIPSTIGECSSLKLDVMNSMGSAGRAWRNVSLAVSSEDANNQSLVLLQAYMRNHFQISSPLMIPAMYFQADTRYSFIARLCNFLRQCSQITQSLVVVPGLLPTVSIAGSNPVRMTRAEILRVDAAVALPSCSSSTVSSNQRRAVSYVWQVATLEGVSVVTFRSGIGSTFNDPNRLVLPSYTLHANTNYRVTLNVTLSSSSSISSSVATATAVTVVTVQRGKIIAKITGSENQALRVKGSLFLDASSSYDEDQEKGSAISGLDSSWSCVQIQPVYRGHCDGLFDVITSGGRSQSTAVIKVIAQSGSEGIVTRWTVLVRDRSSGRSDSASITVTVLRAVSPVISLTTSSLLINQNQRLAINGNISLPSAIVAGASYQGQLNGSWSETTRLLSSTSLSQLAVTPVTIGPLEITSSSASPAAALPFYLVLPANVLQPGFTYTFGLSCQLLLTLSDGSQYSSTASSALSVRVNTSPAPGLFTITPVVGREIQDPFTFSCSQWIDSDLPLTYQFSYLSVAGVKHVVRSLSLFPYGSAILPAGAKARNESVTALADVLDNLNANTTVERLIIVKSTISTGNGSNSLAVVQNLLFRQANSDAVEDLDLLQQTTAIALTLLNQANCSLAPDCESLNRQPCYRTAHTCGTCMSSTMLGSAGDSNEKCSESGVAPPAISTTKQKECVGSCSGHGRCFYQALKGNLSVSAEIPACYEGDFSCVATCRCAAGYDHSPNCALSNAELALKQRLREQVLEQITGFIAKQDASREATVSSWMNTLQEASQVPHELSNRSVRSLLELSGYALTTVTEQGYSVRSSLSGLFSGLDQIATTLSLNSTASFSTADEQKQIQVQRLQSLLTNYSKLVSKEMVAGEVALTAALSNLAMRVEKLDLSRSSGRSRRLLDSTSECTGHASLWIPQSAVETQLGLAPTASIQIPVCSDRNGNDTDMTVSLISLATALFENASSAALTSNVASLYLSTNPCQQSGSFPCEIEVMLRSDNRDLFQQVLAAGTARNVTIHCLSDDYSHHTVTCEEKNYTVACGGRAETIVASCPLLHRRATCNGWIGNSNSPANIGCRLKSFSRESTICLCPLVLATASQRRLSSNDSAVAQQQSVEVSYVGVLESITDNFRQTVLSADSLNTEQLEESWTVLLVLGLFLAAILLAMTFSHYADHQRQKKIAVDSQVLIAIKRQDGILSQKSRKKSLATKEFRKEEEAEEEDFFNLAEEALPQILSSQTFSQRVWSEVKRHHRWLGVVYYFSARFPRILRVVSLATNIIIMLFVQSLTYAYTNGDDGSCEQQVTEEDCLALPSDYGLQQQKCVWTTTTTETEASCGYRQPDSSIEVILLVTVFAALVSAPIALLVDWIINQILAAPTATTTTAVTAAEETTSFAKEKLPEPKNSGQILSIFSSSTRGGRDWQIRSARDYYSYERKFSSIIPSEFVSGRSSSLQGRLQTEQSVQQHFETVVQQDLERLKQGVLVYRSSILQNREQVKEFDGTGGNLARWEESPRHWTLKSLVYGSQRAGTTIALTIRTELSVLHQQLEKEKHLLAVATKQQQQRTSSRHNQARAKRLLYLFQKDLIPGISAEILENKEHRDHEQIVPVAAWQKLVGWLIVGSLNLGMVGYVFLFAVNQDSHRQLAWCRSFAVYLLVDIVVISTLTVLVMHIALPVVILKDVIQIQGKLVEVVSQYYDSVTTTTATTTAVDGAKDAEKEFNAAQYLFLSYRVAQLLPELPAAQLILKFTTPWPKQSYQYVIDVKNDYDDKITTITRPLSILLVFILTNLLSIPLLCQDILVQLVLVSVLGYTMLLHLQLYEILPVLVVIPSLGLCYLLFVVYQWLEGRERRARDKQKAKIVPIQAKSAANRIVSSMDHKKVKRDYSYPVRDEGKQKTVESHERDLNWKATRRQSIQYGLKLASQIQQEDLESDLEEDSFDLSDTSLDNLIDDYAGHDRSINNQTVGRNTGNTEKGQIPTVNKNNDGNEDNEVAEKSSYSELSSYSLNWSRDEDFDITSTVVKEENDNEDEEELLSSLHLPSPRHQQRHSVIKQSGSTSLTSESIRSTSKVPPVSTQQEQKEKEKEEMGNNEENDDAEKSWTISSESSNCISL